MRRASLPAVLFLLAAGGALFLGSRILDSERTSAERAARESLRARLKEAESILVTAAFSSKRDDPEAFFGEVTSEGELRRNEESTNSLIQFLSPITFRHAAFLEPRPLERLLGSTVRHQYEMARDGEGSFYLAEAERAEAVDGDLDQAARFYAAASSPERSQLIRLVSQYRAAALERRRGNIAAAKEYEAKFRYNLDVTTLGGGPQAGTLEDLVIWARSPDPPPEMLAPLLQAIGSPDEEFALGLLRESGRWPEREIRARRLELAAGKRLRGVSAALPLMPALDRSKGWGVIDDRLVSWSSVPRSTRAAWAVLDRPLPVLPEGIRLSRGVPPGSLPGEVADTLESGTNPVRVLITASSPSAEIEAEARRGAWMLGGALAALLLAGGAAVILSVRAARRETEAARARADFVTRVGHDLRTPLAVVRMYAETLAAGKVADPAEAREFAGIAAREAARLTDMVGQALDLSRVAEPALPRVSLDLAAIAAEVAEVHRPLLEHAGIRIEIRVAGRLPVFGDSASLRGAVSNLLENAHRHAGSGGSVEIEAAREGRMAEVRVLDRGPGLPAGMEERVFERFVRGPDAAGSGAGLGLALVREAAEAHGGSARAEDREGGGAAFTVAVPLAGEGA